MAHSAGDAPVPCAAPADRSSRSPWRLVIVLGALAFLQGISEPTEGLVAQPVRSLLMTWGRHPGQIATFWAVLALPGDQAAVRRF
jgi:hypothetical protein